MTTTTTKKTPRNPQKGFKCGKYLSVKCQTRPQHTGQCCYDWKKQKGYRKKRCIVEGSKYKHGQPIPDPDPCRQCVCTRGRVTCRKVFCKKNSCDN
ncbi:hypothetical protein DPMN_077031 [Dreissena polymorpha]|uniref:Uncharacterized protein n=2 Tax=Dreissena polymorpha TaxID=45954 RepID=A0A9D4BP81_DREPO|nr:hypothetical protein DPMN_077031 [Dreissena polymorpha]